MQVFLGNLCFPWDRNVLTKAAVLTFSGSTRQSLFALSGTPAPSCSAAQTQPWTLWSLDKEWVAASKRVLWLVNFKLLWLIITNSIVHISSTIQSSRAWFKSGFVSYQAEKPLLREDGPQAQDRKPGLDWTGYVRPVPHKHDLPAAGDPGWDTPWEWSCLSRWYLVKDKNDASFIWKPVSLTESPPHYILFAVASWISFITGVIQLWQPH